MNRLTVDLEEWFHVCRAERQVPRSRWPSLPHRARESTFRLLDLLGEVRATFFVLGYVARKDPALVRTIASRGHEIACHGDLHEPLDRLAPGRFRRDLRDAVAAIGDACGLRPRGYRAPEWSHRAWSLDILADEGFEYDSSLLALRPRPHRRGPLREFPVSPFLNGTALRLLPAGVLSSVIRSTGDRAVVAVHPWELDRGMPRIRFPFVRGILHYANVGRTEDRLGELLRRHRFAEWPA